MANTSSARRKARRLQDTQEANAKLACDLAGAHEALRKAQAVLHSPPTTVAPTAGPMVADVGASPDSAAASPPPTESTLQDNANSCRHKACLLKLAIRSRTHASCYSYHSTLVLILPYSFFNPTTPLCGGPNPSPVSRGACPPPRPPLVLLSFIFVVYSPSLSRGLSLDCFRISLESTWLFGASTSFVPIVHEPLQPHLDRRTIPPLP